ncbi:MAG TPA: pyridoxal-phosphate dependent enzyme [Anaerolineales bacterium]|nr:pyridoxal-phosphate dependent enzyme [Anaerolineales bacterium]
MPTPLPVSDSLKVYDDIVQTIGRTPLVRIGKLGRELECLLYAKVESFNPGGSVKDRIGLNIIDEAENSGQLRPGGTVVEATSGNTGVGLAIICALRGYKSVFVMPDKMSQEKILLLRAYGGKVVITPTAVEPDDPRSYYEVARRLARETPNAILANQYHNPENPRSHYLTTGPEIWEQTEGRVTDVVIAMGTGGTITGVAQFLKEKNPAIRIVGVDPVGSILLDAWQNGGEIPEGAVAESYKVEGFGEDFIPSTLDLTCVDEVLQVTDKDCFLWSRRLVREEGIFTGGSGGAAVAAAVRYCRGLPADRVVVVLLPDTGSRYLTKHFDDKWMRENGFLEAAWSEIALRELVAGQKLITVREEDGVHSVIQLMKHHDISQVPVIGEDGELAGLVTEISLLNHMLEVDHEHSADETIAGMVRPVSAAYPGDTLLEAVLDEIVHGQVVLVTEGDLPAGILTKIDVLDYISQSL